MNILILTQYFWPEIFRINDVAQGLQERGHRVEVLTGFPNYPSGKFQKGYTSPRPLSEKFGEIPIQRVPLLPRREGRGMQLALNYLSFALSATTLGPLMTHRPDVILVFEPSPITVGFPAAALRRHFGAPVAFWIQDLWPESLVATGAASHRGALRMVSRLVRWIYARCDLLLVQSRAFNHSLMEHGVPLSRIRYLPNSAEGFYQPVELPADATERLLVPQDGRLNVMFAGNLGISQDLPTLLAAAELLKEFPVRWTILGDGRQRSWLEAEIAQRHLGTQVQLLGSFPAESMPRFFALADVLLVSLKDDPAFEATIPSKLQSYLACGRPVIASLKGEGARVTLDAGAGVAIPPEQPTALADAVKEIATRTPEERQAMGERGRAYFLKNFEREYLLTRLEELLEEVTTKKETRR